MPSYAIHLAVAEEYLRKNNGLKENYKEFIKGVVYPDTVKDKTTTHFGECSSRINLSRFINENGVNNSFKKGHFLHLLTDYLFYNKYIEYWSRDIYNDYKILNDDIIKKYRVIVSEEANDIIKTDNNSELKILNAPMVNNFIEEVSGINMKSVINEIEVNPGKWTKIRPLKEL